VTLNIFDQHGSLVNREVHRVPDRGRALDYWHNDDDLDNALLKYVSRVRILDWHNSVPIKFGQTITTIYPINKKGVYHENE